MLQPENAGPGIVGAIMGTCLTFLLTLPPHLFFALQIGTAVLSAVLSTLAVRTLNHYLDERKRNKRLRRARQMRS